MIRLQETAGTAQELDCSVTLLGRDIKLSFSPWEIKTVLLPDAPELAPAEIALTEIR